MSMPEDIEDFFSRYVALFSYYASRKATFNMKKKNTFCPLYKLIVLY